jgi:hypothetical protein
MPALITGLIGVFGKLVAADPLARLGPRRFNDDRFSNDELINAGA